MHVCILQIELDPFKGGNHLSLLSQAKNTQFTIVCNRSKIDEGALPPNVRVIALGERLGPYYYGFADYRFARALLKRFPPTSDFWRQFDCIHSNQIMGPALKRLTKVSVPFVFLIHHPVTADRDVACRETTGLERLQWWLKYAFLVRWQQRLCQCADRVIAVSDTMKKRLSEEYGVPLEKIAVVLNGVDGAVFTAVRDEDCTYDCVAVGSFLHPRKGFRYLVDVYRALASKGYRIADVGRRSEEQEAVLASIDGVDILGMLDDEVLVSTVRHARVMLSTSLFEGFGLSLIEALSSGHPAVAFDVGAVREVLGRTDPTLVIEPRDCDAHVARVCEHLALTSEERNKKGEEYRGAVLSAYPLSKSARLLEGVYRELS